MIHVQHFHFKWHVFVIYLLIMPCPEPPICMSGMSLFPVWSGGSPANFPVSLGVGKIALSSQSFYMHVLGVALDLAYWAGIWMVLCLSVCPTVHVDICMSISMSIGIFVCPSLCVYVCQYINTYLKAIVCHLSCQFFSNTHS